MNENVTKLLSEKLTPFQIDLLQQIIYWNSRNQEYTYFKNHIYTQYAGSETPKEIDKQIKWLIDIFLIKKETRKTLNQTNGRYFTKIIFKITTDGISCINYLNSNENINPVANANEIEVLKKRLVNNKQTDRLKRLSTLYNVDKSLYETNSTDEDDSEIPF